MWSRLANLVGITGRQSGVGKLGWYGNCTGLIAEKKLFFSYLMNEKRKITWPIYRVDPIRIFYYSQTHILKYLSKNFQIFLETFLGKDDVVKEFYFGDVILFGFNEIENKKLKKKTF